MVEGGGGIINLKISLIVKICKKKKKKKKKTTSK